MALATRCPHCATTFRVAHDQLKLRAGLVRCGACKQIFNGVENLLGPDAVPVEPPIRSTPPAKNAPATAASSTEHAQVPVNESTPSLGMPSAAGAASPSSLALSPPVPAVPSSSLSPETESSGKDVDPLTRMTLMDFTAFEESGAATNQPHRHVVNDGAHATSDAEAPDAIEQAIEDLHRKPWGKETKRTLSDDKEVDTDKESDEPDFVKHARRRQQASKTMRWVYVTCNALLLLALIGQLAYSFRDQLAQRLPQIAPVLQQACSHLGCRIGLPAPIQALAIESSELQALPSHANTFVLRVLLRNHYDTTTAWPYLELTLNDAYDKPVARRSFSPAEYLASTEQVQSGFAAQSEQAIAVHFTLEGAAASGFQVYLFYP